jgi:hypothetical protein
VTDSGRLYFDKDFTGLWSIEINLDDFKRLFCLERDSSAGLHFQLHIRFSSRCKNVSVVNLSPTDHRLPMQEFSAWV